MSRLVLRRSTELRLGGVALRGSGERLLEQLRLNEEIERMVAADKARRERRRQKRRRSWIERYAPSEL